MATQLDKDYETAAKRRKIAADAVEGCLRPEMPAKRNGMVVNDDRDGLIAAALLNRYAGFNAKGYISFGKDPWFAPTPRNNLTTLTKKRRLLAVDLMSPRWFSITNHVVLFEGDPEHWTYKTAQGLRNDGRLVSPSYEAGISIRSSGESCRTVRYRYPLGAAQLVLAWLEYHKKLKDWLTWEQLLLVANCDSGLTSASSRSLQNVDAWWSALTKLAESSDRPLKNTGASALLAKTLHARDLAKAERALTQLGSHAAKSVEELTGRIKVVNKVFGSELRQPVQSKDPVKLGKASGEPAKQGAKSSSKPKPPEQLEGGCLVYSWHCTSQSGNFQALTRSDP